MFFRVFFVLFIASVTFVLALAEKPAKEHLEYHDQHPDDVIKAELASLLTDADSDEDGELDLDELIRWVRKAHVQTMKRAVDTQWKHYEPNKREEHTWNDYEITQREYLDWPKYSQKVLDDLKTESHHLESKDGKENELEDQDAKHKNFLVRYERRWKLADEDGDGHLVRQEFHFFLHPEESKNETIRAVLVEELKEDLDQNHDGIISYQEYIQHVKQLAKPEELQDPNFLHDHQMHYETYLDTDKDGALNDSELSKWISPDYDKHELEAQRLFEIADVNRDRKLQTEELMEQFEQFYSLLSPEFWDRFIPEDDLNDISGMLHDEF